MKKKEIKNNLERDLTNQNTVYTREVENDLDISNEFEVTEEFILLFQEYKDLFKEKGYDIGTISKKIKQYELNQVYQKDIQINKGYWSRPFGGDRKIPRHRSGSGSKGHLDKYLEHKAEMTFAINMDDHIKAVNIYPEYREKVIRDYCLKTQTCYEEFVRPRK